MHCNAKCTQFFPQPLGGLILTHIINTTADTTVLSSPLLFVSLDCASKTRGILRQLHCSFVYIPHTCCYSSLARVVTYSKEYITSYMLLRLTHAEQ